MIDLPTRPGVAVRVLIERPANPQASVVLLAGGDGRLDLDAAGGIGRLRGNQLVRTRGLYVAAGFVAALPDIAPEFKRGEDVASGYRWSAEHAADLGAVVRHLRAARRPVYLVGTSRGALSVANAVARLSGAERPDAFVVTAGMLMKHEPRVPSVETEVPGIREVDLPGLLVAHRQDACRHTPATDLPRFKRLMARSPRIDEIYFDGGGPPRGHPCEARHFHGFEGLDAEVVTAVTGWLKALPLR